MSDEPTTYQEAMELLDRSTASKAKRRKKLRGNTWLADKVSLDNETHGKGGVPEYTKSFYVAVEFHGVDVVKMFRDGHYQLAGIYTPTTRDRISRYSPFDAYTYRGYGIISTESGERPYFPHMMMRRDGALVVGKLVKSLSWLNNINIRHYIDEVERYSGFLARKLLNGKLDGWNGRTYRDRKLIGSVLDKNYCGDVVVQMLTNAQELHSYNDVLATLKPEVYSQYWLKPHTVEEEVERYANDLMGKHPGLPGRNFKHPRKLHKEMKELFIHQLCIAAKLEKAERSGYIR